MRELTFECGHVLSGIDLTFDLLLMNFCRRCKITTLPYIYFVNVGSNILNHVICKKIPNRVGFITTNILHIKL